MVLPYTVQPVNKATRENITFLYFMWKYNEEKVWKSGFCIIFTLKLIDQLFS